MVAVLKKWVLLLDLPYVLRDLAAKGYTRAVLDIDPATKRTEIKTWKRPKK